MINDYTTKFSDPPIRYLTNQNKQILLQELTLDNIP